jgi:hypothetical protein
MLGYGIDAVVGISGGTESVGDALNSPSTPEPPRRGVAHMDSGFHYRAVIDTRCKILDGHLPSREGLIVITKW